MKRLIASLLFFLPAYLFAQFVTKKPMQTDDLNDWEWISRSAISNNGEYISYEQNPQRGDGKLIVAEGEERIEFPRGQNARFGSESDFIAFFIEPHDDTLRLAKRENWKKDQIPEDSLGIYVFRSHIYLKFPFVKSFKIAENNSSHVAFLVDQKKLDKEKKESDTSGLKQPGDELFIIDPEGKDTLAQSNVTYYRWAKNGGTLLMIHQQKDSIGTWSSVLAFDVASVSIKELFKAQGWIENLTLSESAERYAFLFSDDTTDVKEYSLYLGNGYSEPEEVITSYTSGIPVGWSPSENGSVWFSEDATKLYLGTAETPEPEEDDKDDNEMPRVEVWNWRDAKLQSQQRAEARRERRRTYLGVYHIGENRFVQLADVNVKSIRTLENGNAELALGYSYSAYARELGWIGDQFRDFFTIDLKTGFKKRIMTNKEYGRISPTGKYFVWYEPEDSSYYSVSTQDDNMEVVSLTKIIPVNFYDENHDTPNAPSPYGVAGWSEGDRYLFIYDRFDIWRVDPSGFKVPVNLTKTFGRRNKTRFRIVKLDPEKDHIEQEEQLLLRAFDERTKSAGFFSTRLNAVREPSLLIMDDAQFDQVKKAKNANRIIFTKESVSASPDIWTSTTELGHLRKVSAANPNLRDFVWPESELVEWYSFSGKRLNGILYKPDNLNPGKKYPMIVYFYERKSDELNKFRQPGPSRSSISISLFVSNGYLVFVPDIVYETGYPGRSAYESVISGTQHLLASRPFVDKDKLGIQGQSWGGYQTAWLITQTEMFAAAMAGAPVSNMTSAYGGIRWDTGLSRMFQYERQQSRIGGSLWEKPLLFIENSPIFHVPKIKTPLLIFHNDGDGAVPWSQGLELFLAMRRLDKPVWMLNYNNEPHNLSSRSWADRMDLTKRMLHFFNHYLKGEEAPEWMTKGIPYLEKGENLGY